MSLRLNVEAIEKRRIEMGLSKQELARRAGFSPGRYTQILREAKEGKLAFAPTAKGIATVLSISPDELFIEINAA
jgi:transcriptional regulator with XRE-family HTH domain